MFDPERKIRCDGKTIVLTGGNGIGIGFETAKELYTRGGNVIILCRNEQKMQEAIDSIQSVTADNTGTISGIKCDLKSFESVRDAAKEVNKKCAKIDICILNAGIMKVKFELVHGIEVHSAVNHFSHFLFLNLIYAKISAVNGRVVSLSSLAHAFTSGNGEYWKSYASVAEYQANPKTENDTLATWEAYADSKLANMFHMRHLAKIVPNGHFFSLHPGVVDTNLQASWKEHGREEHDQLIGMQKEQGNLVTPFVGAQTSLYCSLAPELMSSKYNGLYFDDCKVKESTFVDNAENADKAKNLWDVSVKLTNSDLPTC